MRQEESIESVAGDAWLDELHSGTEPRVVFIFDMQPKTKLRAKRCVRTHTTPHQKQKTSMSRQAANLFPALFPHANAGALH